MKIKVVCAAVIGIASTLGHSNAVLAADEWSLELTPYLWAAGIDGDVSVRGNSANVSAGFSDILENLDIGGSILLEANKGHWVNWMQVDYIAVDTGEVEVGPLDADLESKTTMLAAGTGWRFPGFGERSTIDVLVGVRYFGVDNNLDIQGGGHFSGDLDAYDGIVALRPRLALSEHWTFSPTMSVGAGDSDLVWELSPQLEYSYCDSYELRIGYRNLNYDVEKGGSKVDISFQGPVIGFGMRF